MGSSSDAALPYHKPGIVTTLILGAFILLLNLLKPCQIFLGIAFGIPGANWLGRKTGHVVVQLGYLGLLLLVYETESGVALTYITLPVGLSYVLMSLSNATSLQAFAAGAALCSTGLGTTFAVLSVTSLVTTRIGVVLTSAAMMDDVVGLVIVQVISNLGSSASSFKSTTVIRPIFVSLAFAVAVPLVARLVVRSLSIWSNAKKKKNPSSRFNQNLLNPYAARIIHTAILLGMITATSYTGTANLFTAYPSGAAVSWWDSEVTHPQSRNGTPQTSEQNQQEFSRNQSPRDSIHSRADTSPDSTSGPNIFHTFYTQPLRRIFTPFFFASIGFPVPITRMFSAPISWKGIVYTILMRHSQPNPPSPDSTARSSSIEVPDRSQSNSPRKPAPIRSHTSHDGGVILCTVVGPICVGALVRRVKKLQGEAERGRRDVLRVWGVD
ncbi:hypothetical protein M501DRAFT_1021798 [Patellaria atrata CBS 101060]|uniref:Cation/H+ exchanger domain-containing protein n=1 Tax=Patellaria atrata CBS 101060 TaxID=1346257 RepID=A0A9P4SKI1_9PEZI|nr:hypothetical protein M501DRAFT_1021798 [Patellaria atrata CBS 101060]